MEKTKIKAYKGFESDMTCRGFQYEEGKTYHEDHAQLCRCGFHACEKPTDVFVYYSPFDANGQKTTNRYREVFLINPTKETYIDSERCAYSIKIGRELTPHEMVIEDYKASKNKLQWAAYFINRFRRSFAGAMFPEFAKQVSYTINPFYCVGKGNYMCKTLMDIIEKEMQGKSNDKIS